MASHIVLSIYAILILGIAIIPKINCKEFVVGDGYGWRLNFDYRAWAKSKEFQVGDILVFKYPPGAHNVMQVNRAGFRQCVKTPINEALKTGNDRIVLATPGMKWFICGVGKHCENRLKLALKVKPNKKEVAPSNVKEFVVGDYKGWTLGFDYQAWAKGKHFRVGDKLVFKYPVGAHNVIAVNATGFRKCIRTPRDRALKTGNDTVTLTTPGKKWYICGVGKHCEKGMKLSLSVEVTKKKIGLTSPIAPLPSIQGREIVVGDDKGWTLGFDSRAWTKGKQFFVGDKLVFKYSVGAHNVMKVNMTGFKKCIRTPIKEALKSGNDKILLTTPGKKWYICGVGKHCENGLKLSLNVRPRPN